MAEWLVEEGIGEYRALLVENGRTRAAIIHWPGEPFAGQIIEARLTRRTAGSSRGLACSEDGLEINIDRLPRDVSEGSRIRVELTRAPVSERSRTKRAAGRIVADNIVGPELPETLLGARRVNRFEPGAWEDIWHAAWDSEIAFVGGHLSFSPTPAMSLIDIDGEQEPRALALAAVPAIAQALQWFDIGGMVGIDFPTFAEKRDRRSVDAALAEALVDWPHERTAMNGFGFVQLVARMKGPSLLHRLAHNRAGAAARFALRQAEQLEGAGRIELTCHPAVEAAIAPRWRDALARRTGRAVSVRSDPHLALGPGNAQIVPK